jgi:hypothetical protein
MASERYRLLRVAALGTLSALLSMSATAQVVVTVPGTSDPYLAGMPNGSTCCSGDTAPAQSPVLVTGIALTPGTTVTFTVSGSVDNAGGTPTLPPDGGGVITTAANNGISGATWPINALVGVFLDNNLPTATGAPANLDFSSGAGIGFATLSPALKQTFFIGDARTGTGSGATQTFVVPAGATRLYLGTSDGFGWFNNTGAFTVTVSGSPVVAPGPPAEIPALSIPMLALLSLGLASAVWLTRRRRR